MSKVKKTKVKHVDNPLEKFLNLDDILGFSKPGEKQKDNQEKMMLEGQEITLAEFQEENSKTQEENNEPQIEAGIDYLKSYSREISYVGERVVGNENRELEASLKEIMAEIKKLADSSKELQMQFKEIAVEQHAAKPGKYHKNFFSWLLSLVKAARMKVEDSGAWLTAMHSKKKSREYGAMSKKHGTSFTLNNERTIATSVG